MSIRKFRNLDYKNPSQGDYPRKGLNVDGVCCVLHKLFAFHCHNSGSGPTLRGTSECTALSRQGVGCET
jgi:hypothetical protein